jgi:N-acetylglucosamine-6-phosphate deacetylase
MAGQAGSEQRLEGTFVGGSRLVTGAITIRAGRIVGLASGFTADTPVHGHDRERVDPPFVISPGFIDVHLHGGGGLSTLDGPASLQKLAGFLARRGVTGFLPTSVSAPIPDLVGFLADVRAARLEQAGDPAGPTAVGARILGANLEGPAIDPAHRGAHDLAALIEPGIMLRAWRVRPGDWAETRLTTLAPEQPAGLELVRHLVGRGVIVSLGHSGATFEQAAQAYRAGARSTTHLLNAMTGIAARAPGLAGAALADPRATVELIADGLHVEPGLWPVLWKILGRRLLLVSDAMPAAGLGDGAYRLGSLAVSVSDGRATTADGALAGSTISLADAVANLVRAGCPLPRAVGAATRTPAALLGRRDLGRIGLGARADLVVLAPDGRVTRTMLGGQWLADSGREPGDRLAGTPGEGQGHPSRSP